MRFNGIILLLKKKNDYQMQGPGSKFEILLALRLPLKGYHRCTQCKILHQ